MKVLNYEGYSYKKSLKSSNNFRYIVRPEMLKHTVKAIERAKVIVAHHAEGLNSNKAPCTLVHNLVEELLRLGKKDA